MTLSYEAGKSSALKRFSVTVVPTSMGSVVQSARPRTSVPCQNLIPTRALSLLSRLLVTLRLVTSMSPRASAPTPHPAA